jgi:predicted transcriptional regulator
MSDDASTDVTSLTVQLLSAYLSNNTVPSGELAGLIAMTRSALAASAVVDTAVEEEVYEPAVSVRKSLGSRDFIISMIDGKPYKMLKRHLSLHGLTPAEYRARYNLPSDYPMVAAAYSERRREVAKTLGLGRKGRVVAVDATPEPVEEVAAVKPARKKAVKAVADTPAVVSETAPVVRRGRKAKVVEETSVVEAVKPVAKRAKKAKPEQVSEEVTA